MHYLIRPWTHEKPLYDIHIDTKGFTLWQGVGDVQGALVVAVDVEDDKDPIKPVQRAAIFHLLYTAQQCTVTFDGFPE
jgi:hypothetical protein